MENIFWSFQSGHLTLGAFGVVSCTSAGLAAEGSTSVGGGAACFVVTCTPIVGSLLDPAPAAPASTPAATITLTLLTGRSPRGSFAALRGLSCNSNLVRINVGGVDV